MLTAFCVGLPAILNSLAFIPTLNQRLERGASAASAKKKLKRPSPDRARVYKVRSLLPKEKEDLKTGRWSRIRASGKTPEQDPRGKGFFGS